MFSDVYSWTVLRKKSFIQLTLIFLFSVLNSKLIQTTLAAYPCDQSKKHFIIIIYDLIDINAYGVALTTSLET